MNVPMSPTKNASGKKAKKVTVTASLKTSSGKAVVPMNAGRDNKEHVITSPTTYDMKKPRTDNPASSITKVASIETPNKPR